MARIYCTTTLCTQNEDKVCKAKHIYVGNECECLVARPRYTCGDCEKFGEQCAAEHPGLPAEICIEKGDWPCRLFEPRKNSKERRADDATD